MCQLPLSKKIKLPKNVTVTIQENLLTLSALHGTTHLRLHPTIQVTQDPQFLQLTLAKPLPTHKKYLGLFHSLVKTHLKGITQKFKLTLLLKGIGFKVQKQDTTLLFKLGYSHDIHLAIPDDIDVSVLTPTQLILYGFHWEHLTQFASTIKKLKRVEPYKGKGILFKHEKILRKEGKKNKK